MTHRFDVGIAPDLHPRLDGQELAGMPVQFYVRRVRGEPVCGLWLGGRQMYDVAVYDAAGGALGSIQPEGPPARESYDELRRVLVTEAIRA